MLSTDAMSSSVAASILPKNLLTRLQAKEKEEEICSAALLIAHVILGTLNALEIGELKKLDANPGNGSCQNQALEQRRLYLMNLKKESGALKEAANTLDMLVKTRNRNSKERAKIKPYAFFKQHAEQITVSKEMEFLLHSHMLWVTKEPFERLTNGIVNTRSSPGRLNGLSQRISAVPLELRRQIVEESQVKHTMMTVEMTRASASHLWPVMEEQQLVECMLSEEQTHFYTPDENYHPKAFGCLFYMMKTTLFRLREEKALVCLKSIVVEGKPFHILFQPKNAGGEFELVPDEAYASFQAKEVVVVFEAVAAYSREKAAQCLVEEGFTEAILCLSALQPPYERSSNLSAVQVDTARNEIERFREIGKGSYLILDHVYINTVGRELS